MKKENDATKKEFKEKDAKVIHYGHRDRMFKRFVNGDLTLTDAEVVEMLLFYCIPHKDVKVIAKNLLLCFGSLDNIFNSPPSSLMKVTGVGEKTVSFFMLAKELTSRLSNAKPPQKVTFHNLIKQMEGYFIDATTEKAVVVFLDEHGSIIRNYEYKNFKRDAVEIPTSELAEEVVMVKPSTVIMAHNHPSGNLVPSTADDTTTKNVTFMLSLHGIELYDHLIYGGGKYYSYHASGRLDRIKERL